MNSKHTQFMGAVTVSNMDIRRLKLLLDSLLDIAMNAATQSGYIMFDAKLVIKFEPDETETTRPNPSNSTGLAATGE